HHLVLASFPTRRSADLDLRARLAGARVARRSRPVVSLARQIRASALRLCARDARRTVDAAIRIRGSLAAVVDRRPRHPVLASYRSEEHTSELQSRENIV